MNRSTSSSPRVHTLNRRDVIKLLGIGVAGASAGIVHQFAPRAARGEETAQLPIDAFLGAQGTTSVFTPPQPDQIGWISMPVKEPIVQPEIGEIRNPARTPHRFALVDYCGFADDLLEGRLGTATQGSLTVRPLPDGWEEVTVVLKTDNALTWATRFRFEDDFPWNEEPLLFGYRVQDLLRDPTLTPGLSQSHLRVVFKNPPGAELPDLVSAFIHGVVDPSPELVSLEFRSNGRGPLRPAFSVEVGEEIPGECVVSQTGLFGTGFNGAVADAFPAELVHLRAIGG